MKIYTIQGYDIDNRDQTTTDLLITALDVKVQIDPVELFRNMIENSCETQKLCDQMFELVDTILSALDNQE